jgi:DNA-binding response OmpR family regulator
MNPTGNGLHLVDGGRRLKVLIADDERNIADTIRIILNKDGMDAVAVYGGRAAIEKAGEWHPDVFLVDYVMPDLNGIEAAIEVGEKLPACRVLVISAMAAVPEVKQRLQGREQRFEVLVKPIPPAELVQRIRAVSR